MRNPSVCYCKLDIMSVCTAGSQQRQEACRFYEKSAYAERCMYHVFEEYCDSLAAQQYVQQSAMRMPTASQRPLIVSGMV